MNPAARKLVKAESKETVECSSEPGGEGQLWHLLWKDCILHGPAIVTFGGTYLPETNRIALPNAVRLRSHITVSNGVVLYQLSSKHIDLVNSQNVHMPPFKHRVLKLS